MNQHDIYAIALGATHQHYKGGWYKVIGVAKCTDTGKALMIYQNVEPEKGGLFARPLEEFNSKVQLSEKEFLLYHHIVQAQIWREVNREADGLPPLKTEVWVPRFRRLGQSW